MRIQAATHDDLEELSELASTTFRDTFASQNTAADMEAYVAASFSPESLRSELDDSNSQFFLAFLSSPRAASDRMVGYVKLKTGVPDPAVRGDRPIELQRLYVDRPALGKKVGAALMARCIQHAAAEGYRTLWLGVWEHNVRAIDFYRRWEFEEVGSHGFQLGSDLQTDLIMERRLRPTSAD